MFEQVKQKGAQHDQLRNDTYRNWTGKEFVSNEKAKDILIMRDASINVGNTIGFELQQETFSAIQTVRRFVPMFLPQSLDPSRDVEINGNLRVTGNVIIDRDARRHKIVGRQVEILNSNDAGIRRIVALTSSFQQPRRSTAHGECLLLCSRTRSARGNPLTPALSRGAEREKLEGKGRSRCVIAKTLDRDDSR